MDCDGWRLRVAERHHPSGGDIVVDSEQLAGPKLGDFYPGKQHRANIGADAILNHHTPATGEWGGYIATDCRTDGVSVALGIRTAEGV